MVQLSQTVQVLRARFPRAAARLRRYGGDAARPLDEAGKLGWFALIGGRDIGWALTRYRREMLRLIAEVGMGTGAMAVVGGTAVIIAFVTLSAGSLVAIQGLASLGRIGIETLLGFVAAFINVRLVAPIVTGIALAATVGAGATAELGAMRISEEIDALEVMGIKSMAYLVSTRVLAGLAVIIPLYSVGLVLSFLSPQVVTTVLYGQTSGTYEHYFRTFLRPNDVFWSFVEVIIIAGVVMLTHCYYGYNASGGPVGVGEAVGRSMRFSLVSTPVVILLAEMALYGVNPNFNFTV
jgi:phospholipid/cholesterol/gamma-HCH transport system permease protein